MRWPAAWMFAAVWAAGCHSTPTTFDPFLPNTRIPPPPTGAATGSADSNYLNGAPPFTGSAPAAYPPPPANVPGGTGTYPPAGGYQYQQSPTPAIGSGYGSPGPVSNQGTQFVPLVGGQRQVVQASHVEVVEDEPSPVYERTVAKRASQAAVTNAASSSDVIDLMDLPPVTGTTR